MELVSLLLWRFIMATLQEYRTREHWSYSNLNQFFNICSLQWALQRFYKLAPAFTPVSLSFGSAFHRVMEWVYLNRKDNKPLAKVDAVALFDDLWGRQIEEDNNIRFDEDMDADSLAKQGRDMIACIVDVIDPVEHVIEINEAFCVPLVDAQGNTLEKPLVGEIDMVVEKDGRKLVDWKTSARRWPKNQANNSMQPTVLLYAYKQLHGVECGFRFDVVVKNKTPVFEQHETTRTQDQFNRVVELVKLADSMIAHEHFYPNESSFYCGSCQFSTACKAWHRNRNKLISLAA